MKTAVEFPLASLLEPWDEPAAQHINAPAGRPGRRVRL